MEKIQTSIHPVSTEEKREHEFSMAALLNQQMTKILVIWFWEKKRAGKEKRWRKKEKELLEEVELKDMATLFLLFPFYFNRGERYIWMVNKQDSCNREGISSAASENNSFGTSQGRAGCTKTSGRQAKPDSTQAPLLPTYPLVLKWAVELHLSNLPKCFGMYAGETNTKRSSFSLYKQQHK